MKGVGFVSGGLEGWWQLNVSLCFHDNNFGIEICGVRVLRLGLLGFPFATQEQDWEMGRGNGVMSGVQGIKGNEVGRYGADDGTARWLTEGGSKSGREIRNAECVASSYDGWAVRETFQWWRIEEVLE